MQRSTSRAGPLEGSDIARNTKVIETHISTIFLVGDRAYKLKKPVKTGFLDFSDEPSRFRACIQEVEVNRRFSPDVYLGVADVIGIDGRVCDHLVVMKRMPEQRDLSTLVRRSQVGAAQIRRLARHVAKTHRDADRSQSISMDASKEAVALRWRDSIEQMRPFVGRYFEAGDLELVQRLSTRFLADRDALFLQRITEDRIVDGHGDLKADDIYLLEDGPRILDAIEFDPRLRHIDTLDDAALLVMDMERLGAPDLARVFLEEFLRSSHDHPPRSLVDHYIAYRALVRAKVAALRADQGSSPAEEEARHLMDIAIEHLLAARVMLVLVGGLPGSGKSTLTRRLAQVCGYAYMDSDVVRKSLAGVDPTGSTVSAYRQGIYSTAFSQRTYQAMLDEATAAMTMGASVVIGASWIDETWRARARDAAASCSADLVEFRVSVPRVVAMERLERRRGVRHPSDATPQVADLMARDEDEWPSAIPIDGEGPVDRGVDRMLWAMTSLDQPQDLKVSQIPGSQRASVLSRT